MPDAQGKAVTERRGLVPVLIGVTMVVSIISSLGAPLIPSVAEALDVSIDSAQWSLTAALLAGAIAAPIMGRLGDGRHRREALLGGLTIVVAGGLIAGVADSLAVLVVGRAMQGVGLGLAPLTMAAARDHLPVARGREVIGVLSVSGAAGVGAGYPISGLIAEDLDVRAAFLFGALMAGVALLASLIVVPSSRDSPAQVPLDASGAAVFSAGLVCLLLGIGQGASWGWGSATIVGLFAGAAVILWAWVRSQLRRAAPLVDLRQLRHRAVLTADIAAVSLGLAMYMFLTLVTEFVQSPSSSGYGFDATTLTAGLCMVPFSVMSLLASRNVAATTRRFGATAVLVGGTLLVALAGAFFALEHGALWEAFVTLGIIGTGFGYTFAAIPGLITRAVPGRETGSAMGLYQVIRSVGFSIGSALSAAILASHTPVGAVLPTQQGYVTALWIGAGVCALSAVISAVLGRGGRTAADALPAAERDRLAKEDGELASAGLTGVESDGSY